MSAPHIVVPYHTWASSFFDNDCYGDSLDSMISALAARPAWHHEAACRAAPVTFYPARGAHWEVDAAKAYSARCTVIEECLAWAMEHSEMTGVWGGLSANDRRKLRAAQVRAWREAAQ